MVVTLPSCSDCRSGLTHRVVTPVLPAKLWGDMRFSWPVVNWYLIVQSLRNSDEIGHLRAEYIPPPQNPITIVPYSLYTIRLWFRSTIYPLENTVPSLSSSHTFTIAPSPWEGSRLVFPVVFELRSHLRTLLNLLEPSNQLRNGDTHPRPQWVI